MKTCLPPFCCHLLFTRTANSDVRAHQISPRKQAKKNLTLDLGVAKSITENVSVKTHLFEQQISKSSLITVSLPFSSSLFTTSRTWRLTSQICPRVLRVRLLVRDSLHVLRSYHILNMRKFSQLSEIQNGESVVESDLLAFIAIIILFWAW